MPTTSSGSGKNDKSGMWRFFELPGRFQRHEPSIATTGSALTLADCTGWSGRTSYRSSLGNIGATSRLQRMPAWSGTRRLAGRRCWFHCPASKARRTCTLHASCVGPTDKALSPKTVWLSTFARHWPTQFPEAVSAYGALFTSLQIQCNNSSPTKRRPNSQREEGDVCGVAD